MYKIIALVTLLTIVPVEETHATAIELQRKEAEARVQREAEQQRLRDELARQQQELEQLRQQQQAGGGGTGAPPPPPPGGAGFAPPPPPPGGPPAVVVRTPAGRVISGIGAIAVSAQVAEDAATAAAAAGGSIEDQSQAAATVISNADPGISGENLTLFRKEFETHLARQSLVGDPEMVDLFNRITAFNLDRNRLLPSRLATAVQNAVNNKNGGMAVNGVIAQMRADLGINPALNAANQRTIADVNALINLILFPAPPAVGVASANIGDEIASDGQQLIADVDATIAAFGDGPIDNAIAANPEALAVFNGLTGTAFDDKARRAAFAVLTSPAGSSVASKRSRAEAMLEIPLNQVPVAVQANAILRQAIN